MIAWPSLDELAVWVLVVNARGVVPVRDADRSSESTAARCGAARQATQRASTCSPTSPCEATAAGPCTFEAQLAALRTPTPALVAGELTQAIERALGDWRGLLRRQTAQARQILGRLLPGRVVFTPNLEA